jgi:hypothetical protein
MAYIDARTSYRRPKKRRRPFVKWIGSIVGICCATLLILGEFETTAPFKVGQEPRQATELTSGQLLSARSQIYMRKCDRAAMAGWALVPGDVSSEWTQVQGFGTKAGNTCERGRALARRTGVGSYEVQLISGGTPTSGPDSCFGPEFEDGIHLPVLVTPETAAFEIQASHRTVCTADRGLAEQVIITDGDGVPVDAYFTVAQLARYRSPR